jgi:hypothetical protein
VDGRKLSLKERLNAGSLKPGMTDGHDQMLHAIQLAQNLESSIPVTKNEIKHLRYLQTTIDKSASQNDWEEWMRVQFQIDRMTTLRDEIEHLVKNRKNFETARFTKDAEDLLLITKNYIKAMSTLRD